MKTSIFLAVILAAAVLQTSGDQSGDLTQSVGDFRSPLQGLIQKVNQRLNDGVKSNVKRDVLNNTANDLQDLDDSAENLLERIVEIRQHQREQIDDQEQNIQKSWSIWADGVKQRAADYSFNNASVTDEANNVIDAFLERITNDLKSCASSSESDQQDYENQIVDAVQSYPSLVNNLKGPLDDCLKYSDNNLIGNLCNSHISPPLSQLNEAQKNLTILLNQGDQLLQKSYIGNYCVIVTLTQFNVERYIVENEVDQVIEDSA